MEQLLQQSIGATGRADRLRRVNRHATIGATDRRDRLRHRLRI